ncbi:MAG TPA: NUDIX hydrolase [Sphingomicrobium sp.]|nr:NUDIX hydrolase [Sphingomicrobium sp.]
MTDDAIPAATLILVREAAAGAAQLLMVERAPGMAFAGGALVFPGGRIDEADRRLAGRLRLGEDGPARVAAIRETIEETAVPAGLAATPRPEHCLDIQAALAADQDFGEIVEQAGLELDPGALVPLARWVPRFHARRRFDTLFFVARAPEGDWTPNAIEGECTGAFWVTAAEVLERDRAGTAQLIFPTRRTLERLAQHASFEAIAADARAHPIEPISPWVEEHGGERFIAIPEGIGYPVTREKLDGLWRG